MFRKKADGTYAFSTRFWVTSFIAAILIVFIGYNTQVARNRTEKLAQETTEYAQQTNDCLSQLITVLSARAKIAQENDDLSQEQRKAIFDLLGEALTPPPELRGVPPNDPRYVDWSTAITIKYYNIISKSQARQTVLAEDRKAHPIPDPNCGELAEAPK